MSTKHSVRYCRTGRLLEQLAQGRVDGSWLNYLKQLQKIQILILDDLGLEQLSNAQCNDLLELIEDRYGQSSTIVVSQFPVDKWHGLMETQQQQMPSWTDWYITHTDWSFRESP